MKVGLILFSCLVVLGIDVFAQQTQASPQVKVVVMQDDYSRTKDGEPIAGTPYLRDEFDRGRLYIDGKVFNADAMRYNVHKDVMEYFEKDMQLEILPERSIQRVELIGRVFVVETMDEKPGFFVLLDSGKVDLLCKMSVSLSKGVDRHGMHEAKGPAYSRQKDKYFFKVSGGKLTRLEKINDFIASLPDHRDEMMDYAKQKKLSVKSEEHLILLVNYYNSL